VLWITTDPGVGLGRNRPGRHSVPAASPPTISPAAWRGRAPGRESASGSGWVGTGPAWRPCRE